MIASLFADDRIDVDLLDCDHSVPPKSNRCAWKFDIHVPRDPKGSWDVAEDHVSIDNNAIVLKVNNSISSIIHSFPIQETLKIAWYHTCSITNWRLVLTSSYARTSAREYIVDVFCISLTFRYPTSNPFVYFPNDWNSTGIAHWVYIKYICWSAAFHSRKFSACYHTVMMRSFAFCK